MGETSDYALLFLRDFILSINLNMGPTLIIREIFKHLALMDSHIHWVSLKDSLRAVQRDFIQWIVEKWAVCQPYGETTNVTIFCVM